MFRQPAEMKKKQMAKNTKNAVVTKYWRVSELCLSALECSKCPRKDVERFGASEGLARLSLEGLAADRVL